jgi:hypothetical protein
MRHVTITVEKKYMTVEERKSPCLVSQVFVSTLTTYGQAMADCGHIVTSGQHFNLLEQKDGQFVIFCDGCVNF